MEAHFGMWWFRARRWVENTHDALEDIHDGGFMDVEANFEFVLEQGMFPCEIGTVFKSGPHFDECSHYEQTHLNCSRGVKDGGGHDGTMLGKRTRNHRRKFQAGEVVTICDHLSFLGIIEKKGEVGRKSIWIALN